MKEKVNYVIIFIAILVVLGALYFLSDRKTVTENNNQNSTTTTPVVSEKVEYKNTKYGFVATLPLSWKGYEVINDEWEGYSLENNGTTQKITETGALIFIRHPKWTEEEPRQDIPVMIFTLKQWDDMDKDLFHIGAAPVNPREIARNKNYVFALPARYNYSYYTGFEEVEELIEAGAVKGI